jgi:thiamine transport system substrate-binding protein
MSSPSTLPPTAPPPVPGLRPRSHPGRLTGLLTAGLVALLVVLGAYAVYADLTTQSQGTTLVVYTYDSLLGGSCGGGNTSAAFAPFERAHDVSIRLECPAGTLASTLIAEKGSPGADVVLGLDEVTTPEAEAQGVLVPYSPAGLSSVPASLSSELSPDHAATPYEWGYLGIDSCAAFANETGGAAANLSFPEIAANASWGRNLIVEDPTLDITGEEFLLWEIAFYTQVLHEPWQSFWSTVAPRMTSAESWSSAFSLFTCAPTAPQMVVSYLTDPAYAAYSGAVGSIRSSVSVWNGTEYGWRTVYGAAIVAGSAHLALDRAFLDYLLTPSFQDELPTTEWEYPANSSTPLPAVFGSAPDPNAVQPLNGAYPPATVAADLPGWITDWQTTVDQAG